MALFPAIILFSEASIEISLSPYISKVAKRLSVQKSFQTCDVNFFWLYALPSCKFRLSSFKLTNKHLQLPLNISSTINFLNSSFYRLSFRIFGRKYDSSPIVSIFKSMPINTMYQIKPVVKSSTLVTIPCAIWRSLYFLVATFFISHANSISQKRRFVPQHQRRDYDTALPLHLNEA
jgi:hypothetical protein